MPPRHHCDLRSNLLRNFRLANNEAWTFATLYSEKVKSKEKTPIRAGYLFDVRRSPNKKDT